MPPRNFADDGAIGANSNGDFGTGGGNFGQAAGSFGNNDSGMSLPASGGFAGTGNVDGVLSSGRAPVSGYVGDASPAGLSFAEGGAVPDGDDDGDPNATDPQGSAMGASLQRSINAAMQSVQSALSYGRQKHGLGGGQQEAARMPAQPGNQSESGQPRQQPMPGPLPPTSNPFGKRADAGIDTGDDDSENQAMPSVPGDQSESGVRRPQPTPGPLPPTSNPFGKRADAGIDTGDDAAPGAIDEEEAA